MKALGMESKTTLSRNQGESQGVNTGIASSYPTEAIASSMASKFSMLKVSGMGSQKTLSESQGPSKQHKAPLSEVREDIKSTTVPADAVKTAKRFAELIKNAPNRTIDLTEASETLGVQKEDLYRIINVLKAKNVVVEEKQIKIRWVHDSLALGDKKRLRVNDVTPLNGKLPSSISKRSRFEVVARHGEKLMRSPSYGKKKKWEWLFLTEADINVFVVYQTDVFMMLKCPLEINFRTPRLVKDGEGKQRKYGIASSSNHEGKNIYFVSKLESHDVGDNLGDISRSLPVLEDDQSLRTFKRKRIEESIRSLSDEKNGKKTKWNWLFLTETDIYDFAVHQTDVFMMLKCPCEINLETPRPARDGDGKQRKYGIVGSSDLEGEGTKIYFVSKLESHDVVVGQFG